MFCFNFIVNIVNFCYKIPSNKLHSGSQNNFLKTSFPETLYSGVCCEKRVEKGSRFHILQSLYARQFLIENLECRDGNESKYRKKTKTNKRKKQKVRLNGVSA